jgi:hypothetical protein
MEKFHQPVAALHIFFRRLIKSIFIGIILIFSALFIGMCGYHYFEGMGWIDAFLNASMILSGMGPVTILQHNSSKIFAGFYALFSGLIFIAVIGLIFAPVVHRLFHVWHVPENK